MKHLSTLERLLTILTLAVVAYRFLQDEWPIGVEVEPTEDDV